MEKRDCAPQDGRTEVCYEKITERRPETTELIMGHEKARELTIRQLEYGYMIKVECQTFAIEKLDVVIDMITNYLHNPSTMEEMWRNGELVIEGNIETKTKKK